MKLKRFFCVVLASCAMFCCFAMNAAALESSNYGGETCTVYATGRFHMEVPANKTVKAKSSFPLEVGETVTIKASYSPFSASVDFGVIAPDGYFYSMNSKNGSFDNAIKVNQRGHYYFAVRNNSSETIDVSGYVNY